MCESLPVCLPVYSGRSGRAGTSLAGNPSGVHILLVLGSTRGTRAFPQTSSPSPRTSEGSDTPAEATEPVKSRAQLDSAWPFPRLLPRYCRPVLKFSLQRQVPASVTRSSVPQGGASPASCVFTATLPSPAGLQITVQMKEHIPGPHVCPGSSH